MATTPSVSSRFSRMMDAVTLGYSAAAVFVLVFSRTPVVAAISVIFAFPLILAAIGRILRGLHFALTGRSLRLGATGQILRPPARLGRPSWERQPNVKYTKRRRF